jgi:chromosome segregation ATPase
VSLHSIHYPALSSNSFFSHPATNWFTALLIITVLQIRTAKEVLVDPIRRAQYDNDLLVKAFHFNGQGSGGQLSEDARMEELRKWSYEEGQRQMAKERAERRAGDQARFEADEEELQDLEAEMKEHQRQADLTSIRQKKQEEKKKGVQAEKERRAEDQRSRNRQISEILEEKLAVEARKLQAEADLQALFEERERKAREIEEARLERKRAAEEIDRKRKEGLAAARKQKQGISQSIEAEEHANTQEHTPRLATRVGGRGRRK